MAKNATWICVCESRSHLSFVFICNPRYGSALRGFCLKSRIRKFEHWLNVCLANFSIWNNPTMIRCGICCICECLLTSRWARALFVFNLDKDSKMRWKRHIRDGGLVELSIRRKSKREGHGSIVRKSPKCIQIHPSVILKISRRNFAELGKRILAVY